MFRGHLQYHCQIIALVFQGVGELIGVFRRYGQHDFQILVGLLERRDLAAQHCDFGQQVVPGRFARGGAVDITRSPLQPWQQPWEIWQGFLLPGELPVPLYHYLTGIELADEQDKFGQGIDPRAVEKSQLAQVEGQRRRFGFGGLSQESQNGRIFLRPRNRNEPWQRTVAVAASYLT